MSCLYPLSQTQALCSKFPWLYATSRKSKNDFMGNPVMAAKKICKERTPHKMTIKINQMIPYKMKGPNPAKCSNCISRFLYDGDSILTSSILLLLQYGKVQVGSLQNDLWNGPRGPSNATKWLDALMWFPTKWTLNLVVLGPRGQHFHSGNFNGVCFSLL